MMKGFLLKQARGNSFKSMWGLTKTWALRWVVLEDGRLSYYKTPRNEPPSETNIAELKGSMLVHGEIVELKFGRPFSFEVRGCRERDDSEPETLWFAAASQDELDQWLAAISSTHPQARKTKKKKKTSLDPPTTNTTTTNTTTDDNRPNLRENETFIPPRTTSVPTTTTPTATTTANQTVKKKANKHSAPNTPTNTSPLVDAEDETNDLEKTGKDLQRDQGAKMKQPVRTAAKPKQRSTVKQQQQSQQQPQQQSQQQSQQSQQQQTQPQQQQQTQQSQQQQETQQPQQSQKQSQKQQQKHQQKFDLSLSKWREIQDNEGRVYYHNTDTQETTWSKETVILSSWGEYTDNDKSYYYNSVTGVSTWDAPPGINADLARLIGRQDKKLRELSQLEQNRKYSVDLRQYHMDQVTSSVVTWAEEAGSLGRCLATLGHVIQLPDDVRERLQACDPNNLDQVKRCYKRAIMFVHPDKLASTNGNNFDPRDKATRTLVFGILTQMYNELE